MIESTTDEADELEDAEAPPTKKPKKKKLESWAGDSDDDYVHRSTTHRSGWDEGGKSLSSYIFGDKAPTGAEKQIKEIYNICRNRVSILNETKKRLNLTFNPKEDTGHTDGRNIVVATGVMDEAKPFEEKSDIILGITTHEMAHILHTDFEEMKKVVGGKKFLHTVWNIIEDERIERIVGEDTPGYSGNLGAVKKYFFDEKYLIEKRLAAKKKEDLKAAVEEGLVEEDGRIPEHLRAEDGDEMAAEEDLMSAEAQAMELFDAVFKCIRYPVHLDEEAVGRHETALDSIKEILTPYPKTASEALDAAVKVAKRIRDDVDEMEGPSKGDGEGGGGKGLTKAEAEKLLDELADAMGDLDSENEAEAVGKEPSLDDESISDAAKKFDYRDEWIEDVVWKAVFRKGASQPRDYDNYLSKVKGDAHRLANILHTKVYSESKMLRGMRSGTLDESKIVEAVHGIKTVHTHKIDAVHKKLNICMLIDESYSMIDGRNYTFAAEAAVLIEHAYKIFPVGQLFIYGFTGDSPEGDFNQVIRYHEPGLDVVKGLGDVRPRGENRDGHCMRAVARRVRTFTKEPILFFMISDGIPCASGYGGLAGMKDTRKATDELKKMNFFPVQIGIGAIRPAQQAMMFDDFINYKSSKGMVEDLRRLLLKRAAVVAGI